MANFITPLSFVIFGILALYYSRSQKQYRKMVENVGEESANKARKLVKICGYGLLLCAVILFFLELKK